MLETMNALDATKLTGTYKVRSEYLWGLWNTKAISADARDGVRRTVDRDRETSKSAVTLGISFIAFVVALATLVLEASPVLRPATIASSVVIILLLLVLTYLAQRRVVMSSDLLTKMDLSAAAKSPLASRPLRFLEQLRRRFVY